MKTSLSLFYHVLFFVLVMTVQLGTIALCMIAAASTLTRVHPPKFWGGMLFMLLTFCFISLVFGIGIYLQAKYRAYQERGKMPRNKFRG